MTKTPTLSAASLLSLLATCLLLQACQLMPSTEDAMETLNIEVSYRENMMLPPGSELSIKLEDVSKMDVASTVLAQKVMAINTAPPYALQLKYVSNSMTEKGRYSLRATIRHQGQLIFTSTEHIDPNTVDADGTVKITVHKTGNHSHKSSGLSDHTWQLKQLNGKAIAVEDGQKKPTLSFDSKAQKIAGLGGCNRFFASYEKNQKQLSFGMIGATMMMCNKGMALEQQYLAALAKVDHFDVKADQLYLYDKNKQVLASFTR